MARATLANWPIFLRPKAAVKRMDIAFTGIGVGCGAGHGKPAFRHALFDAPDLFGVLRREGRESPADTPPFLGVEMPDPPDILPPRQARTASFSARAALSSLAEVWDQAGLDAVAPNRIGLIVGGTNLMAREQALALRAYSDRLVYVPPRHGHMFLDTDICGLCTAAFAIRGFARTVGAASASGAVAIISATEALRAGAVDACIVIGAMQDPGAHDLQALRAMGAMGAPHFGDQPGRACRPMDRDHHGFLYGEACAALVLQRARDIDDGAILGRLLGAGQVADGTRGPEPCSAAQVQAAERALAEAGLTAADIDYVNGHATGTPAGDATEIETYRTLGLGHARINATKSITGHPLSAAGVVEVAAVLMQMAEGRLHPTRNLETPLDPDFGWVGPGGASHAINHALKFSFGFGGISTALIIGAP